MIIASFVFFLILFVIIGALSLFKNKHNTEDYLIASHQVSPWLVALSAVATNNSGYMFVGMIGYTYVVGLSSIWLMIGWIAGDFLASFVVHKKLRMVSEKYHAVSFASTLARWTGENHRFVKMVGGFITIIFLGTYAAAQLKAGSKALHVLFGWDYSIGSILGALIVAVYCFAGGIRASIWTDAAQSFVMVVAMGLLFFTTIVYMGGIFNFKAALVQVSPTYLHLFPPNLPLGTWLGPVLFVMGWLFAGFGVVGQPHIMVRFMSLNAPHHMTRVRFYYYSWYLLFYCLTIGAGLSARLILVDSATFDPELALPTLATKLLPDIFIGLTIAGLFAATMSTADSQIISCTAALTNDFVDHKKVSYTLTKLGTLTITLIALWIALAGHKSVFALVLIAWSALASSFAPLMVIYACQFKVKQITAITMMLSGLAGMLMWRFLGWHEQIYEVMPGILAGFIPFLIAKLWPLKVLSFTRMKQ